uniref:RNA-directed DNA polymerase n=1 Tax=Strongyloides stercoralis TaxID=6248 RepID=A0AAF5I381_STRER
FETLFDFSLYMTIRRTVKRRRSAFVATNCTLEELFQKIVKRAAREALSDSSDNSTMDLENSQNSSNVSATDNLSSTVSSNMVNNDDMPNINDTNQDASPRINGCVDNHNSTWSTHDNRTSRNNVSAAVNISSSGNGGNINNGINANLVSNVLGNLVNGIQPVDLIQLLSQLQINNQMNQPRQDNLSRQSRPPPEQFNGKTDFNRWFIKFQSYCRLNNVSDKNKLDELLMLLNDEPLNDVINDTMLQNNYEMLKEHLSRTYKGKVSSVAALHELSLITNRRANKVDDLDSIASRISQYVEVLESGKSKEDILIRKIENLSKVLPYECQSKFLFCGNLSSFDAALATAKRMWDLDSKAEKQKSFGNGINSTKKMNDRKLPIKYQNDKKTPICHKCKQHGHYKSNCPVRTTNQSNTIEISDDLPHTNTPDDIESVFQEMKQIQLNNANIESTNVELLKEKDKLIGTDLKIGSSTITALIDTGANCMIITPSVANKLNLKYSKIHNIKTFQGNHIVKAISEPFKMTINNVIVTVNDCYVTNKEFSNPRYQAIIGMNILQKLNCIIDLNTGNLIDKKDINVKNNQCNMLVYGDEDPKYINQFIESLKETFPLAYAKHEYDVGPGLITTSNISTLNREPDKLPLYSVPIREKDEANKIINNWYKAGVLEHSSSTLLQPIMVISKRDDPNNRKRFIADVRAANSITIPIRYKPPEIQQILADIGKYTYVSKIDLKSAFYQISIPKECRHLFAIKTDIGNFQFTRLVQGGKNSSALFQKAMDEIFLPLKPHIQIYIDDILLISKGGKNEHEKLIHEFFNIANKYQLKIALEKSKFFATNVKFLGFDINPTGISPSNTNVSNLLKRSTPKSKKELYSFLQACGYYRRFVPNYSKSAEILYEKCTGRNKAILFNDNEMNAYNYLRESLTNAPKLHHPNHNDQFIITTDSSNTAIGCTLSQLQNNEEVPLAYFSQKLKPTVRGRAPTYLELFAISRSLRHFKYLLTGCKILIRSANSLADYLSRIDHDYSSDKENIKCNSVFIKKRVGRPRKMTVKNSNNLNNQIIIKHNSINNLAVNENIESNTNAKTLSIPSLETTLNGDDNKRQRGRPKKQKVLSSTEKKILQLSENIINENPIAKRTRGRPQSSVNIINRENEDPFLSIVKESLDKWKNLNLIEEQKKDEFINKCIHDKFYNGRKIFVDNLNIARIQLTEDENVILLPQSLIPAILKLCHNDNGHFSYMKVREIISRNVYFKNMHSTIIKHLQECSICKRRNINPKAHPNPQAVESNEPLHTISIDVMGPLQNSNGYKYILNAADNSTRFVWSIPLETQGHEEITRKLTHEIFMKFGFPRIIKSDGAGNFRAQNFSEYFSNFNIKHVYTGAYHSRGNAIIERSFRTLQASISKLISIRPRNWSEYLTTANYYYNSTKISSLGKSPFELMFIRTPNTILDIIIKKYNPYIVDKNFCQFDLTEKANIIRDLAQESHLNERIKENIKLKQTSLTMTKGQQIYIRTPKSNKFDNNFTGPFTCEKYTNNYVFYKNKNGKINKAHMSNTKLGKPMKNEKDEKNKNFQEISHESKEE